ncbi:hypothetical protein DMN91_003264 [Ooceraea biroi]|uniref:PR domain zinc finger protein n=1 Tax=Ooceraea biroi TaxID=2015173 RepID=A0A026W7M4_OOCBI|nr:PR domain zinc finger protein 10 [Ooceraea biroi]EZA51044.1 PR domain zinc finger protein [Ooceraea biroi]RLU25172.1 hypothetical protein DMN91_003264 [Ooceraea biroi]
MDPRGPPEGAPGESFEISSIDKVADTSVNWPTDHAFASLCEQPKKLNNRLLFLTVEYVEDQSRLFPAYEQISFSPRAASPLSEFEHRVSPLDPNMSSTARYSPTPVQLPSSPFHNPVVVLQGPSSPFISQPESNIRTSINYVTQLAHPIDTQAVPQTDTTTDFVGNGNEEGLANSELILMQETTPELESSATPLMLTGIPSTDFTLTRDFLVMQDEQINVINSFKNQNMEMEENHVALSSTTDGANKENNNLIVPECDKEQFSKETSPAEKKAVEKKDVRRSKRHITDKKDFWCDEYDSNCTKDDSSNLNDVCTIADQPVPSRAVATLPGSYLSLNKLSASHATADGITYGVFAKRNIRRRTQFGPIEGVLCAYDGSPFANALPLLYETENGEFLKVDVSNENTSNWMRFVRPALTYKEQNLIICQKKDGIVFLTNRNISPKEELKAGPSPDYATRRNLPILKPDAKDEKEITNQIPAWPRLDGSSYNRRVKMFRGRSNVKEKENSRQSKCGKEWKCSVCSLVFRKPSLLNLHTAVHSSSNDIKTENQTSACPQCALEFRKQSELASHVSQHGRSALPKAKKLTPLSTYKCSMCYKRFATKIRLQQHCLAHGAEDQKPLPCSICLKRFMNNSALSGHLKTHKENKQVFECPMCRQLFRQGTMLKDHVETHRNQDGIFSCPHCQRTFIKYSVIRKHIRAHHCERKHKCQHCAKRFPTVDKLRMHLLKHSDHREFHCANCGKRFKRKDKLKEHMTKIHHSQTVNGEQATQNSQAKKFVPKVNPNDYNRFTYKCHQCLVGFKRRGMLVNHLAKRHPDVAPESVPELNLPILRQTRDYYCQYCDKVYKSSSKRKAHIMKNHPGAALPPSNRQKESEFSGLPNPSFSQTVGSITTSPQGCQWCHKQYASKAKLLQHQRKKHAHLMEPADQVPRSRNRPPQNQNQPPALNDNNFVMSDYMQGCDVNGDFLKQKIIKITNDVDLIGNGGLEMVGQQFVRMRDIR